MKSPSYHIEILPHGRRIVAKSGETILESLLAHNIVLRTDCGGKGVCGKCRVETTGEDGTVSFGNSCTMVVGNDIAVRIPEDSFLSAHIIDKAPAVLPESFTAKPDKITSSSVVPGIAVDLGTTTIAVYLSDLERKSVISSIAVKNPQALYGDDVMSRIGRIGEDEETLIRLQQLVVKAIDWGVRALVERSAVCPEHLTKMVVVGNPTMIHILLGMSPASIGISPYVPKFYKARKTRGAEIGFAFPKMMVQTLPQVSGFLGGDILAAALATELDEQPAGTLLVDLGTNGELVLKGKDGLYATSCATGPAFEGAALSCGMQAIPGAIDKVCIASSDKVPEYTVIQKNGSELARPSGLCGSGVISTISSMLAGGIIDAKGLFNRSSSIQGLLDSVESGWRYQVVPADQTAYGREIVISQKDIRAVQLGKGALSTGIAFLMRAAKIKEVRKIFVAGAFGSYIRKEDMITLGMIPAISPELIEVVGNSAGAGAIMALCDENFYTLAQNLAERINVIELAANCDFQNIFVQNLSFPVIAKKRF